MRVAKAWVFGAVLMAMGAVTVLNSTPSSFAQTPRQERRAEKAYWRFHDGRWNYWDPVDSRWYYTNGTNWFYYGNNAWNVYRFDKNFGRDAFERGSYVVPAPNATIAVPTHGVYVPPLR